MSNRFLMIAALAVASSAPAFATAAAAAPAKPAPAAQAQSQTLTRAALLRSLDTSFKAVDTNGDGTLNPAELKRSPSG